jgi:ribosomal protein S1
MKKTIAIVLSLILMFAFAAATFAADQNEAAPMATKTKIKHALITGEVTAVDAKANTITVMGKKGDVTISVSDKTKMPKGKTLADVKTGDKITVRYTEADGKNTAVTIAMKAAPMMKKEEKAAAPAAAAPAAAAPAKKAPGY